MSTFKAIQKVADERAPRIVSVPVSAWKSAWAEHPRGPVDIGIRFTGNGDDQLARADAGKQSWALHPHEADEDLRIEAHNDALMRWVVARGACQPFNAARSWFERDEVSVRERMTSDGVRFLYEAVESLLIEEGALSRAASNQEIAELAKRLAAEPLAGKDAGEIRVARRALAHIIDSLGL